MPPNGFQTRPRLGPSENHLAAFPAHIMVATLPSGIAGFGRPPRWATPNRQAGKQAASLVFLAKPSRQPIVLKGACRTGLTKIVPLLVIPTLRRNARCVLYYASLQYNLGKGDRWPLSRCIPLGQGATRAFRTSGRSITIGEPSCYPKPHDQRNCRWITNRVYATPVPASWFRP